MTDDADTAPTIAIVVRPFLLADCLRQLVGRRDAVDVGDRTGPQRYAVSVRTRDVVGPDADEHVVLDLASDTVCATVLTSEGATVTELGDLDDVIAFLDHRLAPQ